MGLLEFFKGGVIKDDAYAAYDASRGDISDQVNFPGWVGGPGSITHALGTGSSQLHTDPTTQYVHELEAAEDKVYEALGPTYAKQAEKLNKWRTQLGDLEAEERKMEKIQAQFQLGLAKAQIEVQVKYGLAPATLLGQVDEVMQEVEEQDQWWAVLESEG